MEPLLILGDFHMSLMNTSNKYGRVAVFLHWLMAILVIGLLTLGLYMSGLPKGLDKLKLYGWHKEYGVLVLALVTIRLAWRLLNTTPILSIPLLEKLAARGSHWALYGFMFAMPMTGWLMTSAAGFSVSFFGLFMLPNLVSANPELKHVFHTLHTWLGYGLIATITIHFFAALKHHFINKDSILKRML
jgi:cytochrome b561